ncbi:hypothetical protein [Reichenbachiella sp.]
MEVVKDEKTGATFLKIQVAINADEVSGPDQLNEEIKENYKDIVIEEDFLGASGKRKGIIKLIKEAATRSTFMIALSLAAAIKQPGGGS